MAKNSLLPFVLEAATPMSSDVTTAATNIQFLDNVAFQLTWTGNPEGTFAAEVSNNYDILRDTGSWEALPLDSIPVAVGTDGSAGLNLVQLAFAWVRIKYTNTLVESGVITTVADSSGSLNDTYFLLNTVDGTEYYVWFNINSAGTDPALPGKTALPVALATDATADQVADGIATAIAGIVDNVLSPTNTVTFDQEDPGAGLLEDGADPTGFTFAYTTNTGELDAVITAKAV